MATGSVTSVPVPEKRRAQERELVEYERYIDQELRKTARQVQGMDISTGVMCWLAGALIYLMAAAAADHWLVNGGLGVGGRWLALTGLLLGSGWYFARSILPPLLRRINPVYSAHTIELGRPQLKNSLVNFLLLRREPRELPELVREALQAQAASGLAAAPVEHAIDRTPLVRFALVLLGAVLISAIYIMFSPKDPLRSAARVILPWASIERPTRFKIEDIRAEVVETGRKFTGGPAEVFYGQRVKIAASVSNRGSAAEEPIVLRFTTADGSAADQELTLEQHERFNDIVLPAGTLAAAVGGGLQQSLDYTLTAGDAVAGPFHIKVLAAPSIEIASLEYAYPAYTKLPGRTVKGQGDVNAIEGTSVIVRALANQEISTAWIDLDCDGRPDANGTMKTSGKEAGGNFLLALQDGKPLNASYLLRFKNTDGFENPQPIRYRIDVTPDLPPTIAWESPREVDEPRELPIDEAIEVVLTAADQDFQLKSVKLLAALEGEAADAKRAWNTELLKQPTPDKWTSAAVAFVPAKQGFKAGETLLLRGQAEDNRPTPNVAETAPLKIKLLPPRDPQEKQGPNHQPSERNQPQEKNGDEGQADQQQQPGQEGDAQRDRAGNEDKEPPQNGEGAKEPQNGDKQNPGEKQPNDAQQQGQEQEPGEAGDDQQQQQQQKEGQQSQDQEGQAGGGEASAGGEEGQEGNQSGASGKGQPEQSGKQGAGGAGKEGEKSTGNKSNGQQGQQPGEGSDGDGEKAGQPGQNGSKHGERRVDPDSQEGDAFERMMDHFNQQDDKDKQGQGAGDSAEEKNAAEGNDSQEQKEKGAAQKKPDKSSTNRNGESAENEDTSETEGQAEQGAGEGSDQKPGDASQEKQSTGAKPEKQNGQPEQQPGQEGGASATAGENGQQEREGQDQPQADAPSKDPGEQQQEGNNQAATDNQRAGGAGQQDQKNPKGTPEAQGKNRQRGKTGEQKENKPGQEEDQPQSPSNSDQHSDSKGGEQGDQSGGGKEGGGQNAEQDGTGSAGSNTEADDGSGVGKESGDGETDGSGGDDRQSQGATGDPNSKQTEGSGREGADAERSPSSQQKNGGRGKQPQGANAPREKQPSEPQDSDSEPSGAPGEGNSNGPTQSGPSKTTDKQPNGGQANDENQDPPPPAEQPNLGGDAANQDYANRATDLVLNKLKDQLKKGEPDEALLEKLQWSKEDLERFVKRWEAMKAAAKQPGAQGKKAKDELDEALKSLGLRPHGTTTRAGKTRQDKLGVRDSRRSEPPAEYADQYRQFNVDASKGR